MEQEFSKERKPAISLMSKRFRFFVCFVAIACVFSCTAILFFSLISLVSVQRRLALVESKLDAISEKFEQSPPEVDTKDSPIARHKRSADPLNSLADLSKRPMALEIRWDVKMIKYPINQVKNTTTCTVLNSYSSCFVKVNCLFSEVI